MATTPPAVTAILIPRYFNISYLVTPVHSRPVPDSSQLWDYFEPLHINLILSKFNNVNKVPVNRSRLQTYEDTQAYLLQEDAI